MVKKAPARYTFLEETVIKALPRAKNNLDIKSAAAPVAIIVATSC